MKRFLSRKVSLAAISATLLAGGALVAITGCADEYRVRPEPYRSVYYDPYDYYYYPDVSVYFHISSGYYYYRDGANWVRVRTLPAHFYLNDRNRVRLAIKSNKPYRYYKEHRTRYVSNPTYQRDHRRNLIERENNQNRHKQYRRR